MIEDKLTSKEYEKYIAICKSEGSDPNNLITQFLYLAKTNNLTPVSGEALEKAQIALRELDLKKAYAQSKAWNYWVR